MRDGQLGIPVKHSSASLRRAVVSRAVGFFALWLVLMQSFIAADLAVGVAATGAATWASLRLMPPAAEGIRFARLLLMLANLFWQSLVAGIDVSRRVLARKPQLNPGFVRYPLSFSPGMARHAFASITGLYPGTLACGDPGNEVIIHCLELTAPVIEQLREEERRLQSVLVTGQSHG